MAGPKNLRRISTGVLILLAYLALPSCRTGTGSSVLARGRVLVQVTDQNARPLPGIRITLTAPDGKAVAVATTSSDGAATFENLLDGRYSVRARAPGARAARSTHVMVRAGLESTVMLTLERDDADTVIVKPKT